MSGVPKELDETAFIDGYSFPVFFIRIFIPATVAGIGVAAFSASCFPGPNYCQQKRSLR